MTAEHLIFSPSSPEPHFFRPPFSFLILTSFFLLPHLFFALHRLLRRYLSEILHRYGAEIIMFLVFCHYFRIMLPQLHFIHAYPDDWLTI